MKTIQLITLLILASISLNAQEPRTVQSNTQIQDPKNVEVKKILLDLNQNLQQDIAEIDDHVKNISRLSNELESITNEYTKRLTNLIENSKTPARSQKELNGVLEEMKEIHNAYYLQYRHLQDTMNQQAQLMQMMSNILKNHYDTEKSMINNIR